LERRSVLRLICRTAAGGLVVGIYGCGTTRYTSGGVDCGVVPDDPECLEPFDLVFTTGGGHTHTFTISSTDLDDSEGDITYTSSETGAHTHDVTLTAAERDTIASGGSVPKTTTVGNSHTHGITFEIPEDLEETTSTDSFHSHTFLIPGEDLLTPADEKTYTSSTAGHSHTVTLTGAERVTIAGGGAVGPKTTSTNASHSHTVTFSTV